MSWSVSASGKIGDVQIELDKQFSYPLSESGGLSDAGEKETVRLVAALIGQCLSTFDQEKTVNVSANGHISFDNWNPPSGAAQNVSLTITPRSDLT